MVLTPLTICRGAVKLDDMPRFGARISWPVGVCHERLSAVIIAPVEHCSVAVLATVWRSRCETG